AGARGTRLALGPAGRADGEARRLADGRALPRPARRLQAPGGRGPSNPVEPAGRARARDRIGAKRQWGTTAQPRQRALTRAPAAISTSLPWPPRSAVSAR